MIHIYDSKVNKTRRTDDEAEMDGRNMVKMMGAFPSQIHLRLEIGHMVGFYLLF